MVQPGTLVLLFTGLGTGFVGAMLGLGGGVFLVPVLTLGLGVPIKSAIAASLLSVIATASASATVTLSRGLVNLRLGLVLEVATSAGGLTGGLMAARLSSHQLFVLFALTLAVMGLLMAVRSGQRNVIAEGEAEPGLLGGRLQEGDSTWVYRVKRLPVALVGSLFAGAVSGLLGLGGGIIKVPILNTFCGVPIRVATSTSTFMIGVTATASAVLYYSRGDVVAPLTAAVCLGALPGSLLGTRLAERLHARYLKVFMAVVLLAVAARMALAHS